MSDALESLQQPVTTYEQQLRDIDKECMSWADTVHYQDNPIIAASCEGEIITDINGNRYIDTQMWHSSCNFGYKNQAIEKAVRNQLDVLPQISGDFLHQEKLMLAEEISRAMYERTGLKGRVSFNVGGTLVVEDALKIIRKNTRKNKVATFMGAYHGRSLTVSGLSSSHRYREYYGDFPNRSEMFAFPTKHDCFFELNRESEAEMGRYYAKMIKKRFENDFYGIASENSNELGGFCLELCQGRGYAIPPMNFFKEFIPNLKQKGLVVFDDEIQVGMFRTGKLFAFEHFGITPDIVTLSKSFTNGLSPLSVVWAREDLVDPGFFGPGHAHSNFANHSLGTAAALATWRYMMSKNYEQTIPKKGRYYLDKLRLLQNKFSFIGSVDGLGLLLNMTFQDEYGKPYSGLGKKAVTLAQDYDYEYQGENYRMILNAGGYASEGLKIAPCLDISYAEIDRSVAILDQVFQKLAQHIRSSQ